MSETNELKQENRLCSEIQLFDLCDLEVCRFKNGRFCTNADLIERFEKISEDDDLGSTLLYIEEETDDEDGYDDELSLFDSDDMDAGDIEESRQWDGEE